MNNKDVENQENMDVFRLKVKNRSDSLMNYFLAGLFLTGLILATFYATWLIAFGVGGSCIAAYYLCKLGLPDTDLYQYVLSIVLAVFMAQFIYQMHGMFEMHFFAFIGSAILVTYQNWKLQIPIMIFVLLHHAAFSYMQNIGVDKVYFSQLDYFDVQTFITHTLLAAVIFFICGLLSYQLKKYNEKYINQSLKMVSLQREAAIHLEKKQHAEALEKAYIKTEKARVRAEQAIKETTQANKELKRKNKELEQFAYVASHDLQEPLRTSSSYVKLMQKQYSEKLDERANKYLNYVVESSDRMSVQIKDLLDFSRIGYMGEFAKVDCNIIMKDVLADLDKSIHDSTAEIRCDDLPVINGYATEMRLLFQNLLINAIKFKNKNTNPQINISAVKIEDCWQFAFTDNGIGIEKHHNEKIFIIFQRLHNRTEYSGSGIGLSHCKKIVELHHGKIWVESKPGVGSTFYFTLPADVTRITEKEMV